MHLTVLAALLFLQYPDAPQQQPPPQPQPTCQAGQIVVDAEGHCCWPGQAWKKRGCHGKPYCPQGLVADRHDTCVPPRQQPAPQPQAQPQPQYQPQPGTYNPYPPDPNAPPTTFAGVPAMPPANAVPVRFSAAKPEDTYEIEVLTSGMPACTTPCELRLVPDRHAYKLRVKGAAHFSDKLRVLNQPMDLQIQRGSGGYKALGTVSVIVGAVAFAGSLTAGGLVALAAQSDREDDPFVTDRDWARRRNEKLAIAGSVSFVGLVVAVVGGVIGFKNAGHTGIFPVRAGPAPENDPAPAAAPAPDAAPAPEAAPPPPSSRRDEPALQLLGLGLAPTGDGAQVGAVFAF